jgi:hypothetical protein
MGYFVFAELQFHRHQADALVAFKRTSTATIDPIHFERMNAPPIEFCPRSGKSI